MNKDEFAQARAALGITQVALARHLGVYRPTVTRWELGLVPIPGPVEACLALMAKVPRKKWPIPDQRAKPVKGPMHIPDPEYVESLDAQVQATLEKLKRMGE